MAEPINGNAMQAESCCPPRTEIDQPERVRQSRAIPEKITGKSIKFGPKLEKSSKSVTEV
ncbi:MAG: hypothetical protein VB085_06920 [Peptococcaceae bacterium]|nr:hypothetical protein [Peptococcaceae bacterium]